MAAWTGTGRSALPLSAPICGDRLPAIPSWREVSVRAAGGSGSVGLPLFRINAMRKLGLVVLLCLSAAGAELALSARDTVTGFEMNPGDTVKFKLRNGQLRTLVLERTEARVLLTNLKVFKKPIADGGMIYEMAAQVRIDGHPLRLVRYVSAQETFAEPYVVNGMRLWLDAVDNVFEFLADNHGGQAGCQMQKRARFAANDALDRVAPVELQPWYPIREYFLDIGNSYNGDDPYYGAYKGSECHAGLDINHPKGSPLFAPVDIDDHFLFDSLAKGANNNRWRGFRTWPNGDRWTLQAHHIIELTVPEHTPIRAGAAYAKAAGVMPGNNEHSHFVFRTQRPGGDDMMLDPWILFWQFFEQEKQKADGIRAAMTPLAPARVGSAVKFESAGSRKGRWGQRLNYYWTFGDGGFSRDAAPVHVFARPGIYAVTLVIDDGVDRASATQLMTADGPALNEPSLTLECADELSFRRRKPEVRDTYGLAPKETPHTIRIAARLGEDLVRSRYVQIANAGGGTLAAVRTAVQQEGNGGWLTVLHEGAGNAQSIQLKVAAKGLTPALYRAVVRVECPGAHNSPQEFEVVLDVRQDRPPLEVVSDNSDESFHATPYFWVCHKFKYWKEKGYGGTYLTNGARAVPGEVARFQPLLRAGRYEVRFADETPFGLDPESRFAVRVKHKHGEARVWVEPNRSRHIGQFEFEEGAEGFVEIEAGGSRGQVLVDAVRFQPAP